MKSSQPNGRTVSEDTIKKILEVYGTKRWHEISGEKLKVNVKSSKSSKKLTAFEICKLGKELMTSISRKYVNISCKNDSEERWLHFSAQDPFIYKEGKKAPTFSDKVDSMAVLIHNNCVFNWKMLSELINLVKSDKIRIKTKCMELMYSSFMEVLPVRKLRYIDQLEEDKLEFLKLKLNGFYNDPKKSWEELEFEVINMLLAVTFEDFVKGLYSTFIQELSDLMNRGVEFLQKNASNLVLQMLIQKPEQEEILLDLIICRLGHKDNKMSSYVFKMLDTLLLNHEKMKVVVVKKIVNQINNLTIKLKNELTFSNKKVMMDENHRRRKKRRRGSYIGPDTLHLLKNLYLCILYISKLQYNKNDDHIVDMLINNSINTLLLFISTNNNNININSNNGNNNLKKEIKLSNRALSSLDETVDLSKYEECNRIIKILLLFLNKLLNYHKKFDKYEENKNLLSNKLNTFLYKFCMKTQSVSIKILVLSLLHHWASNQDKYHELLESNVLNIRLYESTNLWQFLSLVQKLLENKRSDNSVLVKRLLQMSLINNNNNVNSAVIEIVLTSYQYKNHLWELDLQKASFNPQIITTVNKNHTIRDPIKKNLKEGLKRKSQFNSELSYKNWTDNNLYNQLSIFSGCVQPEYTLEKYWKKTNRKCEPYQRSFQLYYESKGNLSNEEDNESEESEELEDIEEIENLDIDEDEDEDEELSDTDEDEEYDDEDEELSDTDDDDFDNEEEEEDDDMTDSEELED